MGLRRACRLRAPWPAGLGLGLALGGCALAPAAAPPGPAGGLGPPGVASPLAPTGVADEQARPRPVVFEPAPGAVDSPAGFVTRGPGHAALLTGGGAVLAWERADGAPAGRPGAAVARLTLVGARPGARPEGADPVPARASYFVGRDPAAWRTGVPRFARVRVPAVYPGIDLVWHGERGALEFDLVVAPGADPGRIRLRAEGAGALVIDGAGALRLGEGVALGRPHVYQDGPGGRRPVAASYVRRGADQVAIALGPHDRSRPLVIDPVIVFSTYLGGSGDDAAVQFAADAAGNLYTAGTTTSPDLPALGGLQAGLPGFRACTVTKLDPTASVVLYTTYLGGSAEDRCLGMAVDAAGGVYLAGTTSSADFPVTAGAVQLLLAGGGGDAFVARIAPGGDALVYATYLGGAGLDLARGIAIDGQGSAWIAGVTTSPDFPRAGAVQAAFGGVADAFLARVDTLATGLDSLVFATYFGGGGADGGDFEAGVLVAHASVAVDTAGNAFLAGSTTSVDLPVLGAVQPAFRGVRDAFVAKFAPAGALLWSTYLGGGAADAALAVATDALGTVYVAGATASFDFPATVLAAQPVKGGGEDGFVTALGSGGALVYSTFFGGSNDDAVHAVFADVFGRAHVTGRTNSPDLPLIQAVQGPAGGGSDAFVAVLARFGIAVESATYLGGTGSETGLGITADQFGVVYAAGTTASLDFPLVRPLRVALGGASDAFLVRLGSLLFVHAAVLPIARSVQAPTPATFFASVVVAGAGLAVGCRIAPVTPTPTTFLFQTTDPTTNALVGTPNVPVSIPAGGVQTFLIAFGTSAAFGPTEVILEFACANTPPARLIPGVNQPALAVSTAPVPDVVALAATAGNDGIVVLDTPAGGAPGAPAAAGAFAVATVNLGASARITVSADDNGAGLGLILLVCPTDPATGACLTPPAPAIEVDIATGQTPTFGVFALTSAPVSFDPAARRVFVRFRDAGGALRGATSVAVRSP